MKNFLIITAIIMLLTGFYDWYIPIIIVLSLLLSYMLLYLSVRFLMGIIFVPLRQNQFFAIKGVGDTDKTATGNGNLVNIVGYAIEIVKKRKQGRLTDVKIFITFSFKNGEKIESDKNPYHWIWLFIGGYPALWPKIHLMAKYNFGWGKILVGKDKLVDPRNEIVDSFFYSYIYGITVQVPTLDRQSLEITYRVPLKLKNFIIAYCCLPTGDWLKKYNAAFYAGTKFYTSQKNSKDLLKEDYVYNRPFVIPTTPSVPLKPSDLLGTLYEQYLPDAEISSGYELDKNDDVSVLGVTDHISQELKSAQEKAEIAIANKEATLTNADAQSQADIKLAEGIKALTSAEINAFKESLPDTIKNDPVAFAKMFNAFQQSKWTGLTAYGVPSYNEI